jgi:alpha-methylacyl-CoA racemase
VGEKTAARQGPLAGLRIVELAGLGPAPFCAMVLADLGADVLRVDRLGAPAAGGLDAALLRGRRTVALDLKHPDGVAALLELAAAADGLLEGFRPGVAERLGVGPDACLARNPRLVYGRMTGWGQDGPLAPRAGHDINYVALAGVLDMIGTAGGPPVVPLNLVGDFGGGGMLLALGMACGLLHAQRSGEGQVVDAAMVDGVALLATMFDGMRAMGAWNGARGTNLLDGGAPFYTVYETADGGWMSVGALEPPFYSALLATLRLDPAEVPDRDDPAQWPALRERLAAAFRQRTRAEWSEAFDDVDACVAPVLTRAEAEAHPHHAARATFATAAPRFSRTPGAPGAPAAPPQTEAALRDWGFSAERVAALREAGAVAQR